MTQTLPDKVSKFIKLTSLRPLNQVDTLSKHLPKDIVTKSGWHIDYYGQWIINDNVQLNVTQIIYNDTVFHSLGQFYSPDKIHYDSMVVLKETNDFIYLNNLNSVAGENLFVFSTKTDNQYYDFYDLIVKDLENNIFVYYSNEYCQASNKLYLYAINLNTGKWKTFHFKNYCEGGKNNWCIDNVKYINGKLTLSAKLTTRRTKKEIIEIHSVKL